LSELRFGRKTVESILRVCGSNLNAVRTALERPDGITQSAILARDEIGRAIAFKIREAKSPGELATVAEDVLPEIEKFLESPAEKRLRRVRRGTTVASIGLGATVAFVVVASIVDLGLLILAGLGLVTLFIGLSLVINGLLFTVPKKTLSDKSSDARSQRELDAAETSTNELVLPEPNGVFSSVTEHTTRHLKEKQSAPRN
jgi:hypothetical protein